MIEQVRLEDRLSKEDFDNLKRFNNEKAILRARVSGVANLKDVGLYVFGRAGTGKTYTILETLESLGRSYRYVNCRISPGGLFDMLAEFPDDVFVIDDVANLYQNPQALQVLQAAMNGEAGIRRSVTWQVKGKGRSTVEFAGGIIAVSNLPLNRDPVSQSIASRVKRKEFNPSDAMMAAFMRLEALKGYCDLPADTCLAVVDFVIAECTDSDYRIDLRMMQQSWDDYRLCEHGESFGIPWEVLVRDNLKTLSFARLEVRDDDRSRMLRVALDVFNSIASPKEQVAEFNRRTGKSKATYYRWLDELESMGEINRKSHGRNRETMRL